MKKYLETINFRIRKNKSRILTCLENNNGNIKYACRDLGIHRSTFYRWLEKDETFRKETEETIVKTKRYYGDAFAYELAKSLEEDTKNIREGLKYLDDICL